MNAIDFLIKEHTLVRQALKEINDPSHHEETKMKLFDSLCHDLIRHETMEHQVWYPHFKNDKRLSDTVRHLLTEEKGAEKAIHQLDHVKTATTWDEKFAQFKTDVEHHAREEETNLFPEVKQLLSEADLEKIGLEMYHFKQNYPKLIH